MEFDGGCFLQGPGTWSPSVPFIVVGFLIVGPKGHSRYRNIT